MRWAILQQAGAGQHQLRRRTAPIGEDAQPVASQPLAGPAAPARRPGDEGDAAMSQVAQVGHRLASAPLVVVAHAEDVRAGMFVVHQHQRRQHARFSVDPACQHPILGGRAELEMTIRPST